ncbi:MAG: GAF domain-containing sensor histidine kinase [Acidimicrobiia bacterium]
MSEQRDDRDDLLLLIERASSIVEQVDLQSLLDLAIDTAMELTGARYGALGVVDERGRIVEFHHRGVTELDMERIGRPPVGRGVLGDISRHGSIVRVDDITKHDGYTGMPSGHPEMSSFLGVPVKARDRIFGNLYVTEKAGGFDEQDEITMSALAALAGTGIDSIRMMEELQDRAVREDRDRIARDVHDSIIQNLFAVGLGLQARAFASVDDPDLREALDDASVAIDASIAELRRLIYDLHGDLPRRGSVAEEVAELAERLGSPYEIPVEIVVSGSVPDLDVGIIDDVLQIVRESVSNALRHSGASSITVSLSVDDRSLVLTIEDDGDGFDVGSAPWGLGLTNMRTRTMRAGGELAVKSSHGSGTTVTAQIPLTGASGATP